MTQIVRDIQEVVDPLAEKYGTRKSGEINYKTQDKRETFFSVIDVLEKYYPDHDLEEHGEGLQGSHPHHGSDTGFNFKIVPEKNVWTCFHAGHECGGGPFELLAVFEDIIKCGSWSWGDESLLKGKKWRNTVEAAFDKDFITTKQAQKLTGENGEEKTTINRPSLVMEDLLAEQVHNDGINQFAIWDGGNVEYRDKIDLGDKILKPVEDETVEKGAVLLPSEAEDYEDINSLLNEIKQFIEKWVDISKQFKEISAWYVLLSWVYDRLSTIPYLRLYGDWGTGKTRGLKTIGGLCYKAIDTAGATTAAAVERMVERWGGSLLMNEADFYDSDTSSEIVKILNEGFERSGVVIKAHKERQGDVVLTRPYSPKILATRKRWKDEALESRCITEKMRETDREDILPVLTDEFREEQQKLRNKLLMFRFKNYHDIDENEVKEIWPKLQEMNLERRLVQATISFSVLFWQDEEMFERFNNFLKEYQEDLKQERAATFDGGIVRSIHNLMENEELVTPSNISDYMEDELNYNDVRASTIGRHLKSIGLETKPKYVDGKTRRVLNTEKRQLKKVFNRYLLDYNENITDLTLLTDYTDTVESERDKVTHKGEGEGKGVCKDRKNRNARKDSQKEIVEKILNFYEQYGDPEWTISRFLDSLVEQFENLDREDLKTHVKKLKEDRKEFILQDEMGEVEKIGA